MLDDRKLEVLRAIVEDYVQTHEPVGSKALVDRHRLGVSSATVRNDMAALEEDGLIAQPHTSAGRIPTDKGYRLFVDNLTDIKPLTSAERRAIATFLQGAIDLDDVVHRSVRLLAQLTQQVAIVQYPTLSRSTVRHVEVVTLTGTRLLLVLITSAGRVEQRVVELVKPLDEEVLADLRARLNACAVGQPLADGRGPEPRSSRRRSSPTTPRWSRRSSRCSPRRSPTSAPTRRWRSAVRPTWCGSATSSTARSSRCSRRSRSTSCCSSCSVRRPARATVTVRIGHEVPYEQLAAASIVATGYGPGDRALATLGVLGPTRMDYPGSMAAVQRRGALCQPDPVRRMSRADPR